MSRRGWTHRKRHAASSNEPPEDEGIELVELRAHVESLEGERDNLHKPFDARGVPNLRVEGDRRRLALPGGMYR